MFSKKRLLTMFWPVFFDSVAGIGISMLMTMMVSGLGEYAVSATSIVGAVSTIAVTFVSGVTTGTVVRVSQYFGAGNKEMCEKTARQSVIATVSIAIIGTALMLIFGDSLMHLLFGDAEAKVLDAANLYLRLVMLSMPFFGLYASCNNVMYATGDFKRTMKNSMSVNFGNLLISAFMIFVLKLGIFGAGLSLIICRGIFGLLLYRRLCKGTDLIKIGSALVKPDFAIMWSVMRIGLATALDGLIVTGSNIFSQALLVKLGTNAMAAYAIMASLSNFVTVIGCAINNMSVTVVGQCFGTGDMKMCRRYMNILLVSSFVATTLCCVLCGVFADFFMGLYSPSQETIDMSRTAYYVMLVMVAAFWTPAMITASCLRGTGDVKIPTAVSITALVFVKLPIFWFIIEKTSLGLIGVWLAVGAEWIFRAVFVGIRALSKTWERTELI